MPGGGDGRLPPTIHIFVKFAVPGSHLLSYVEISIIPLQLRISNTFSTRGFFSTKNTKNWRYFLI